MKAWVTQLRKGLLEFCLLNALAHGESYGYQLVGRLKGLQELCLTESTLYPILNRLRKDGCVKVREVPSPAGPPRRYYSLSVIGRHRLREMNGYWSSLCESIGNLQRPGWHEPVQAGREGA